MTWYSPLEDSLVDEEERILCWETTVIFIVSSFQYLILAAVFSKGRPYRKPLYSNKPFLASLIILTLFSLVLTTYPGANDIKLFLLVTYGFL